MISLLSKKSIGIDIADRSIVIVQLESRAGKVRISGYSRVSIAAGIIKRGKIRDEERLKIAVKEALEKAKPNIVNAKKIIFGIPERRLFAHIFEINSAQKNQVEALVAEEAKKSVPIEPVDLIYGYKILDDKVSLLKAGNSKKEKFKVLFIATNKSFVRSWQAFFAKLDIDVEAFDVESLSIYRGLDKKELRQPLMIMDIGAVSVNFSIFDKNGLFYSHALGQAGDYFTKKIAESIRENDQEDLDLVKAEKMKIAYGISGSPEYQNAAAALKSALTDTTDAMKEAIRYFYGRTGELVRDIVLVGGSSELKGLPAFLTEAFSGFDPREGEARNLAADPIAIKFGEPILNIKEGPLFFVEAIGLAWRGLEKKWFKNDPYILPKEALTKDVEVIIKEKEDDENSEQSVAVQQNISAGWISAHKREVQLLVLLIGGIMLISGAFWYRDYSNKQRLASMRSNRMDQYSLASEFNVVLPVNTSKTNAKSGQIRGRQAGSVIAMAMSYEKAVKQGKEEVGKDIKKGEVIWEHPLDDGAKRSMVFPLQLDWLIFSEQDANNLFLSEAKKLAGPKADFILDSIRFESLNRSRQASSSLFYLTAKIKIMSKVQLKIAEAEIPDDMQPAVEKDQAAAIPASASSPDPILPEKNELSAPVGSSTAPISANQSENSVDLLRKAIEAAKQDRSSANFAVIKKTEIGWLNVRSGPDTTFPVVKKALSGDKYEIIEENEKWVRIMITANKSGWASKEYIERTGE